MTVLEWLLDSDPAIRWQVMRDLTKRDPDGWWPLEHAHHDELLVDLSEREGEPGRWITLRALRVLRWAGGEG
jgi:hypothetical protein